MRQFLALRSEINNLKDDMPTSTSERSQTIDFRSPRQSDSDDVFFVSDPRKRINSDPSIQTVKSYSSGSDDEKLWINLHCIIFFLKKETKICNLAKKNYNENSFVVSFICRLISQYSTLSNHDIQKTFLVQYIFYSQSTCHM